MLSYTISASNLVGLFYHNFYFVNINNHIYTINNIKNIITCKFKNKMWCKKGLDAKIKLRYYKEV